MYLYIRLHALNFMLNNVDYSQHCEDLNRQRGNTNLEIPSEEYNRYRGAIVLVGASIPWMRDTAPTASTGYSI